MSSSNKTDKLTPEQQREENMAIFVTGQIMGFMALKSKKTPAQLVRLKQFKQLMSELNVEALQRFYESPRSDPKQGSDFRYREQIRMTILLHKQLYAANSKR